MVTVGELKTHLDYTAWASARLVAAGRSLSLEERVRDFGTGDHNVLGTLVHVYAADRLWLGRVLGAPPARFVDPEHDMHWRVLENDWPPLLDRWRQWLATATDTSAEIDSKI